MDKEEELYPPIKAFLEGQGYVVKGEVGACDVVAVRGEEPPVVVELKLRFNLALVLQAVDRLALADHVYLAVPAQQGPGWTKNRKRALKLCRRLGLGLLTVKQSSRGIHRVEPVLDPGPYQPRVSKPKRGRLLKEFFERVGDPNVGGTTGIKRITAYRQDALRLAAALADSAELSPAALRASTGVERAGAIVQANHYGWFERVRRGVYVLSPKGAAALDSYPSIAARPDP